MNEKAKILLVEDEKDVQDLMVLHLKREGLDVTTADDGKKGLELATQNKYQLAILDWMLPQVSGLDICKKIHDQTPVLMVTARTEAADIVLGLEMGADDYITKPFEIPVFLARVRALLRRSVLLRNNDVQQYRVGDLFVDLQTYLVQVTNEEIKLTTSEFKILASLLKYQGKVLSREKLVAMVQGAGVAVVDRVIDTHVFGLRKKLGAGADVIETIRGIGYRVRA